MPRKVILLELNEVPWRIVDDHVDAHRQSALAGLLPVSHSFCAVAADRGHLSPWTTWPSLHRGVNDEHHMIGDLGQDHSAADEKYPPIWQVLHASGVSVGVFGSLHTYPVPPDMDSYSFYVPDAFASDPAAFPPELSTFQSLNLKMARESARNVDTGVPVKDALTVLKKTPALGIRPQTYAALSRQLIAERRRPWRSTRRRTFQAVLAFDLFMKQLGQRQPAFASFFTNHVASAMHRYWAATYPEDYDTVELGADWIEKYREEIPWAMAQADKMIQRLVEFVDSHPDYTLWIAASMGQGPTVAQPLETALYLTEVPTFMSAMGLPADHGWETRPAMLPQTNVEIAAPYRDTFEQNLKKLRIRGAPLAYRSADNGFYSLQLGHLNLHNRPKAVRFKGKVCAPQSLGLEPVEIEDRSNTTAYHVPEGLLTIYDPADRSHKPRDRSEVSALSITPAILENFGVPRREYMQSGAELASVFGR